MDKKAHFARLATVLIAVGFWIPADAQDVPSLRGRPSKDQILEALSTSPSLGPAVRTRGLSLSTSGGDDAPTALAAAAPAPAAQAKAAPQVRAVDLEIPFEFNSDRLTDDGREVLVQLGQALNSGELAAIKTIFLEGHTDAKGNPAYNQVLSLRRAQSVRSFLQTQQVPSLKLKAVGKGARELADPNDPEGAINRRVRVIVVS